MARLERDDAARDEHSFTGNFEGEDLADHIGTPPVSLAPDPTLPGSQPPAGQQPSPFKASVQGGR